MHSTIYELTRNAIDPDEWADEENFYEDINHSIDYCSLLEEDERQKEIEDLVSHPVFCGVFSRGTEPDTIIYNGNIDEVKDEWYGRMKNEIKKLEERKGCDTYSLRKVIDQPFADYTRWCLPDWCGTSSHASRELVEWLSTMEAGTVLHVNSVFDYHW